MITPLTFNFKIAACISAALIVSSIAADGNDALKSLLPKDQHSAADFITTNMPDCDKDILTAEFLAENIDYAFRAREIFPWAKNIPEDLFLNDVLPYANLNERRDAWRKPFFERFGKMVAECKTAGEAAIKLNTGIYDDLNVHYSKQRSKACQSPFESMEEGKASCTGLSILLVNACRAVGIPARITGTPLWVEGGGNHTWVEVWDGTWHSIGASESKALNQTWFDKKAATQISSNPENAIYAVSYKKTDISFPMVWDPSIKYISAVNVTANYAASEQKTAISENIEKALSTNKLTSLLAGLEKKDILIASGDLAKISTIVWQKHVDEVSSDVKRRAEHDSKSVTFDKMTMKYAYEVVGDKPKSGYPLYIAMHGGGGAPATVNDSQWEHMKFYYLNGVTNGIYLAPRGLNNDWNLHWINQSFACYDRIIENMIAFGEVDPNRVYIMGYSAGGDAAYQIPARMPDRWAAVGMSAGHPNGVPPDNYAALAFLIQVGEKDSAYKRNQVAAEYGVKLDKLEADNPGLYRHAAYLHTGCGHGIMDHGPAGTKQKVFADPSAWLEKGATAPASEIDCHSIRWMDQYTRTPLPEKIIWDCGTRCERSGSSEPGFWPTSEKGNLNYWIGIDRYDKTPKLEAGRIVVESDRSSNTIKIKEIGNFARLYLSPKMLDLDREVTVLVNGLTLKAKPKLSLKVLVQSILDRGDPNYAFPSCLTLSKNPEGTWMLE